MSLYYLAGYLLPSGVALIVAPDFTLDLLGSNTDYGDILPRVLGLLLVALGMIVAQNYVLDRRARTA